MLVAAVVALIGLADSGYLAVKHLRGDYVRCDDDCSAVLGSVYADASYLGPVNIGVAITGLIGYPLKSMYLARQAGAAMMVQDIMSASIPRSEDLLRTTRVDMAPDLIDKPDEIVRSILGKFISGVTNNRYDPFSKVQKIAR